MEISNNCLQDVGKTRRSASAMYATHSSSNAIGSYFRLRDLINPRIMPFDVRSVLVLYTSEQSGILSFSHLKDMEGRWSLSL